MICFLPVVRLRDLGKQVEVRKFNEATTGMTSVDKLIAGIFYRFAVDEKCPAVFIKCPKEGDEVIPSITVVQDFEWTHIEELCDKMIHAVFDKDMSDMLWWTPMSNDIALLTKLDFKKGAWENYGYEYTGVDGISIPS